MKTIQFSSYRSKILLGIILIFASIGFLFVGVFVAMQFGWTNVKGSSIERNASFGTLPVTDNSHHCIGESRSTAPCDWIATAEWVVVKGALVKDAEIIKKVSDQTGVSERIIVSAVIPEQLRYFTSNRESFKRFYEPLKILSSMSKFSLGVSGIKQETAKRIEEYVYDTSSDFYPGGGMADLIAYPEGVDHDDHLYSRLTDSKDHYYSYLYTALYLKQITMQWKKAGYDVSARPDVLVTLFNLGFNASNPNADPKIAGSVITLGGKEYRFGLLGTLFYQSDQLVKEFSK